MYLKSDEHLTKCKNLPQLLLGLGLNNQAKMLKSSRRDSPFINYKMFFTNDR